MMTIYRVRILDEEGRSTVKSAYFADKEDAEHYRQLNDVHPGKPTTSVDAFSVWEKGEYEPEKDLKLRALAKLTSEERKALGLE